MAPRCKAHLLLRLGTCYNSSANIQEKPDGQHDLQMHRPDALATHKHMTGMQTRPALCWQLTLEVIAVLGTPGQHPS
jgi:hypothetical protein